MSNLIFVLLLSSFSMAANPPAKPLTPAPNQPVKVDDIERRITTLGKYRECRSYDDFAKYMDYLPTELAEKSTPDQLMGITLTLMNSCNASFADFRQLSENLKRWGIPKPLILGALINAFSQTEFNPKPLLTATNGVMPEKIKTLPTTEFMGLLQYLAHHKYMPDTATYATFYPQAGLLLTDCQSYLEKKLAASCGKLVAKMMTRFHWYSGVSMMEAMKELRTQIMKVPNILTYDPREIYGICFAQMVQGPAAVKTYTHFLRDQKHINPAASKKNLEATLNMAAKLAQKSFLVTTD